MMFLMLCLLADATPADQLIAQRRYLDAALNIRRQIADKPDPALIRKYTVLVTEKYVTQLGFRVFFLANLSDGKSPYLLRGKKDSIVSSTNWNLVEQNLEELLVMSQELFPENFDIQFAVAFYLHMGECCIDNSRLKMSRDAILEIFKKGDKKNIFAARSLFALAQEEKARKRPRKKQASDWYRRAFDLDPEDLDLGAGYLEYLLDVKEYAMARDVAQKILDGSQVLEQRLVGLHGAARAFLGLGDYPRALKAVDVGLRLVPEHVFLWMIGLDTLRERKDSQAYSAMVMRFVDRDPEDPQLFALYVAYIREKGVTDMDRIFLHDYAQLEPKSDLAKITQLFNMGSFAMEESQFGRAVELFREAEQHAKHLPKEFATLGDVLARSIRLALEKCEQ